MRSFRRLRPRRQRALAEIVGTLMLVVIVVAAATAFSFFVASYQKQLQAEETLSHDRALESVKVLDVAETTCAAYADHCNASGVPSDSFANVSFLVASLDVNKISISGLFLDGTGVVNYTAVYSNHTAVDPCYNASQHKPGPLNLLTGLVACVPIALDSYSSVRLYFNLDENLSGAYAFGGSYASLLPTSVLTLKVLTLLTNAFTESFTPPSAIASVFFVSSSPSAVPVFDGLNSYQPVSSDNSSIVGYSWSLYDVTTSIPASCPTETGPEVECPGLTSSDTYSVNLTVTNTDGLTGLTSITYTQP